MDDTELDIQTTTDEMAPESEPQDETRQEDRVGDDVEKNAGPDGSGQFLDEVQAKYAEGPEFKFEQSEKFGYDAEKGVMLDASGKNITETITGEYRGQHLEMLETVKGGDTYFIRGVQESSDGQVERVTAIKLENGELLTETYVRTIETEEENFKFSSLEEAVKAQVPNVENLDAEIFTNAGRLKNGTEEGQRQWNMKNAEGERVSRTGELPQEHLENLHTQGYTVIEREREGVAATEIYFADKEGRISYAILTEPTIDRDPSSYDPDELPVDTAVQVEGVTVLDLNAVFAVEASEATPALVAAEVRTAFAETKTQATSIEQQTDTYPVFTQRISMQAVDRQAPSQQVRGTEYTQKELSDAEADFTGLSDYLLEKRNQRLRENSKTDSGPKAPENKKADETDVDAGEEVGIPDETVPVEPDNSSPEPAEAPDQPQDLLDLDSDINSEVEKIEEPIGPENERLIEQTILAIELEAGIRIVDVIEVDVNEIEATDKIEADTTKVDLIPAVQIDQTESLVEQTQLAPQFEAPEIPSEETKVIELQPEVTPQVTEVILQDSQNDSDMSQETRIFDQPRISVRTELSKDNILQFQPRVTTQIEKTLVDGIETTPAIRVVEINEPVVEIAKAVISEPVRTKVTTEIRQDVSERQTISSQQNETNIERRAQVVEQNVTLATTRNQNEGRGTTEPRTAAPAADNRQASPARAVVRAPQVLQASEPRIYIPEANTTDRPEVIFSARNQDREVFESPVISFTPARTPNQPQSEILGRSRGVSGSTPSNLNIIDEAQEELIAQAA